MTRNICFTQIAFKNVISVNTVNLLISLCLIISEAYQKLESAY